MSTTVRRYGSNGVVNIDGREYLVEYLSAKVFVPREHGFSYYRQLRDGPMLKRVLAAFYATPAHTTAD